MAQIKIIIPVNTAKWDRDTADRPNVSPTALRESRVKAVPELIQPFVPLEDWIEFCDKMAILSKPSKQHCVYCFIAVVGCILLMVGSIMSIRTILNAREAAYYSYYYSYRSREPSNVGSVLSIAGSVVAIIGGFLTYSFSKDVWRQRIRAIRTFSNKLNSVRVYYRMKTTTICADQPEALLYNQLELIVSTVTDARKTPYRDVDIIIREPASNTQVHTEDHWEYVGFRDRLETFDDFVAAYRAAKGGDPNDESTAGGSLKNGEEDPRLDDPEPTESKISSSFGAANNNTMAQLKITLPLVDAADRPNASGRLVQSVPYLIKSYIPLEDWIEFCDKLSPSKKTMTISRNVMILLSALMAGGIVMAVVGSLDREMSFARAACDACDLYDRGCFMCDREDNSGDPMYTVMFVIGIILAIVSFVSLGVTVKFYSRGHMLESRIVEACKTLSDKLTNVTICYEILRLRSCGWVNSRDYFQLVVFVGTDAGNIAANRTDIKITMITQFETLLVDDHWDFGAAHWEATTTNPTEATAASAKRSIYTVTSNAATPSVDPNVDSKGSSGLTSGGDNDIKTGDNIDMISNSSHHSEKSKEDKKPKSKKKSKSKSPKRKIKSKSPKRKPQSNRSTGSPTIGGDIEMGESEKSKEDEKPKSKKKSKSKSPKRKTKSKPPKRKNKSESPKRKPQSNRSMDSSGPVIDGDIEMGDSEKPREDKKSKRKTKSKSPKRKPQGDIEMGDSNP